MAWIGSVRDSSFTDRLAPARVTADNRTRTPMGLLPRHFHPARLPRLRRAWEATWNGLEDNLRGAVWQVLSNLAFAVMAR